MRVLYSIQKDNKAYAYNTLTKKVERVSIDEVQTPFYGVSDNQLMERFDRGVTRDTIVFEECRYTLLKPYPKGSYEMELVSAYIDHFNNSGEGFTFDQLLEMIANPQGKSLWLKCSEDWGGAFLFRDVLEDWICPFNQRMISKVMEGCTEIDVYNLRKKRDILVIDYLYKFEDWLLDYNRLVLTTTTPIKLNYKGLIVVSVQDVEIPNIACFVKSGRLQMDTDRLAPHLQSYCNSKILSMQGI